MASSRGPILPMHRPAPLMPRFTLRRRGKYILCMTFLAFFVLCLGALFFVPDLREKTPYLVWSPSGGKTINNAAGEGDSSDNVDNNQPVQIERPKTEAQVKGK